MSNRADILTFLAAAAVLAGLRVAAEGFEGPPEVACSPQLTIQHFSHELRNSWKLTKYRTYLNFKYVSYERLGELDRHPERIILLFWRDSLFKDIEISVNWSGYVNLSYFDVNADGVQDLCCSVDGPMMRDGGWRTQVYTDAGGVLRSFDLLYNARPLGPGYWICTNGGMDGSNSVYQVVDTQLVQMDSFTCDNYRDCPTAYQAWQRRMMARYGHGPCTGENHWLGECVPEAFR